MHLLTILSPFIFYVIVVILWQRSRDKRLWNKGISPYTNESWEYKGTSQGGNRCYSDSKGNFIYISRSVDK